MGFSFKHIFANPAKTVADISTGGITLFGRSLPKKVGGGESGVFSKSSEVIGATTIGAGSGAVTGFATAGPYGAIYGAVAGGAAGFGRGVSGVVNNESGKTISAGSAKWGAISGGIAGAAKLALSKIITATATKAATSAVVAGENAVTAASGTTAAAAGSSPWSTLGTAALLAALQRPSGQPAGSSWNPDISVTSPGSGPGSDGPSVAPVVYPSISSGRSPEDSAFIQTASSPTALLFLAVAAVLAFFLFKKKVHH